MICHDAPMAGAMRRLLWRLIAASVLAAAAAGSQAQADKPTTGAPEGAEHDVIVSTPQVDSTLPTLPPDPSGRLLELRCTNAGWRPRLRCPATDHVERSSGHPVIEFTRVTVYQHCGLSYTHGSRRTGRLELRPCFAAGRQEIAAFVNGVALSDQTTHMSINSVSNFLQPFSGPLAGNSPSTARSAETARKAADTASRETVTLQQGGVANGNSTAEELNFASPRNAPAIGLYRRVSQYSDSGPSVSGLMKSWNEIVNQKQFEDADVVSHMKAVARNDSLGLQSGILHLTA